MFLLGVSNKKPVQNRTYLGDYVTFGLIRLRSFDEQTYATPLSARYQMYLMLLNTCAKPLNYMVQKKKEKKKLVGALGSFS